MILTILAFLIVLGILVLVHEFGHFVFAKRMGVKVLEFAFGFPPRLFSFKRGETKYAINAIPFGGYVKMLGELESSTSPRAFENQTPGKRFVISIAGVLFNIILAWMILALGFAVGMTPLVSRAGVIPGKIISSESIVADVKKDSPAERVGLKPGDILVSAVSGGEEAAFETVEKVGNFTRNHRGEKIRLVYRHNDLVQEKEIELSSDAGQPLGVALAERAVVKVPWYKAPYVALRETWEVILATYRILAGFLSMLFQSGEVAEGVGGPVAIYIYSGLAFRAGLIVFLQFIALLSINLALINILPFPALDGGRLLFIALEKIRGRKVVREEIENIIHTVGFVILIALLIAVTYRDIIKLF